MPYELKKIEAVTISNFVKGYSNLNTEYLDISNIVCIILKKNIKNIFWEMFELSIFPP